MKRIFTICIVVVGIFLSAERAVAQEIEMAPPKWELGVDLYSLLLNRDQRPPMLTGYSLILKRQITENKALRFRPGFSFEYMPDPIIKGTNRPRNYDLSFDIGFEKQKKIKRFVHYYGADFRLKYIKVNSTIGLGIDSASTFTKENGYTFGLGIAPFIGGKFLITNRVAIAVETSCMLSYLKYDGTTQQVDINNIALSPKVKSGSTNGINFDILPISFINLSYNF